MNTEHILDSTCALRWFSVQDCPHDLTASKLGKCLYHAGLSVDLRPWPVGGQTLWELRGTEKAKHLPNLAPTPEEFQKFQALLLLLALPAVMDAQAHGSGHVIDAHAHGYVCSHMQCSHICLLALLRICAPT